MSVLNQSGEEQVECPLCMEALEVDDLNFFPCTCGYQICRFCWHRIRTDENGLCPACRKAYSEDPADFIPLSKEQVAKLKADKRHRDQQRKAKLSENRKHLASVRVVQRNLVFVVGLPVRLADPELLKKHEYFGKFGKIHKVVINQSTSYAGSQGPSASAYVTYMKSDDALRAIQTVNNVMIDGRMLKSSLGTTKYCSHFMKNQPCPKADCMYLHDFGDPEASFTKEQMHAGKHQEYEKKLHDAFSSRQNSTAPSNDKTPIGSSPPASSSSSQHHHLEGFQKADAAGTRGKDAGSSKDSWPQLNTEKGSETKKTEKTKSNRTRTKNRSGSPQSAQNGSASEQSSPCSSSNGLFGDSTAKLEHNNNISSDDDAAERRGDRRNSFDSDENGKDLEQRVVNNEGGDVVHKQIQRENLEKFKNGVEGQNIFGLADPKLGNDSSFFSQGFQTIGRAPKSDDDEDDEDDRLLLAGADNGSPGLLDSFPHLNTSEDWVFGFDNDHLEELATQASRTRTAGVPPKESLDTIVNGIGAAPLLTAGYGSSKFFDDYDKTNGYGRHFGGLTNNKEVPTNGLNGLDHNMSKFFMDFHKNQTQLNMLNNINSIVAPPSQTNGYYQQQQQQQQQQTAVQEHILLLQQKQLEEQYRNLSLKQQQNYQYQNGFYGRDLNGSSGPFGGGGRHLYNLPVQSQTQGAGLAATQVPPPAAKMRSAEDELDFDPFQESQKGFAELMAREKNQTQGRQHVIQSNQGLMGGHIPPPPPGFVQPQNSTHMNSFGSKILPFLNMSNNPQSLNSPTQNSWPNGYVNQHKNISTNVNDWKNLDPAILSSSRHFPLANISAPSIREHTVYPNLVQQSLGGLNNPQTTSPTTTTQNMRPHSYADFSTANLFSNLTQQLQQQPNNVFNTTHTNSWFTNEGFSNTNITSPPGFRNSQQTKQQEC